MKISKSRILSLKLLSKIERNYPEVYHYLLNAGGFDKISTRYVDLYAFIVSSDLRNPTMLFLDDETKLEDYEENYNIISNTFYMELYDVIKNNYSEIIDFVRFKQL